MTPQSFSLLTQSSFGWSNALQTKPSSETSSEVFCHTKVLINGRFGLAEPGLAGLERDFESPSMLMFGPGRWFKSMAGNYRHRLASPLKTDLV